MDRNEKDTAISLRWPLGLREAVRAAAAKNRRSMNAEIVIRLERDLSREGPAEGRAA